jgi:hypothetical protein
MKIVKRCDQRHSASTSDGKSAASLQLVRTKRELPFGKLKIASLVYSKVFDLNLLCYLYKGCKLYV